jgi:hypothetical protein
MPFEIATVITFRLSVDLAIGLLFYGVHIRHPCVGGRVGGAWAG